MNNFDLSEDTKAVLLLCCKLVPTSPLSPLSPVEYDRLAKALHLQGMRPASIFEETHLEALASSAHIKDGERLKGLLSLRGKLGFFLEEWQQVGIWILSRGDASYPERIKKHLGDHRPPILFGRGDISILQKGGLGVVGSRNIDQAGESFTRNIGQLCAQAMIPVVSGGARGVDSIAMLRCAEWGGYATGFLADSLIKKSLSKEFHDYITNGHIVLVTPYNPKAGFSVGAAMGRNKLIYAQSNQTLIISSDFQKGGTWAGAIEELKRPEHRTIFVRDEEGIPIGNKKIISLGGIPFSPIIDLSDFKNRVVRCSISSELQKHKILKQVVQDSLLSQSFMS